MSQYTQLCPICSAVMTGNEYVAGPAPIGKDSVSCINHYSYERYYGTTKYIIGILEFSWHYTDTQLHIRTVAVAVQHAMSHLKKELGYAKEASRHTALTPDLYSVLQSYS